ncbi:MAG: protein kinase [Burkholderiales bacterium]|nr:protein kinase [Burkholderiales bacterium]
MTDETLPLIEHIGKYRVIRELGRGATGAVYLAEDSFNNRNVAIKMMFPEVLKHAEDGALYRSMFLNEASLAGKILHPHIVGIFDAVVDENMSYIVMEYVEGGTLERFCAPDNFLPTQTVAEIVFKCVRALAFANTQGLIHRDVKPGNILYKSGSDIKLADFGAAFNRVSDKTQVAAVGSPLYMAPEILTGAKATVGSDIYALGVVMYMLLAGRPPFEASNPASLMYQIVNHEPEPPSRFRADVTALMEDIVKQAMAKDVNRRYQNWEDFGKDLAALWQGEQSPQQNKSEVSDTEQFSLLKTLSFFRNFPENELWEVLKISKWRPFPAGTVLISEGDVGDSFFILAEGNVKVTRGKRLLNVLGVGDCFGEMSYLAKRDGPRSASITTATDCIVMKVRAADLNSATASCRRLFDRKFLETLVERLETANQQLAVT